MGRHVIVCSSDDLREWHGFTVVQKKLQRKHDHMGMSGGFRDGVKERSMHLILSVVCRILSCMTIT